jgi:cyclopropane fatty-acyl-phospholipid synthase-like methyltransferase
LANTKVKVGFNRGKLIKKAILKPKVQTVLEIGSGIGLVGRYIQNQNPAIDYTGIELDAEAFKKSQTLKLNTINGDFTQMATLNQEFDVIMLWEVIEHLQNLDSFMKLAYQKLKVGGKIILSAPNYNKIDNYPNRSKDQLFQNNPPIHLNFFTKKSFRTVFEQYGFQNIDISIKKTPYLEFKKTSYYLNLLKALFNKYQGATLYLEAQKRL